MHMAEKWKTFMESASVIKYNVANVNSMTELDTASVYNYVKRCLAIANTHKRNLTMDQMAIINTTLQWMDISKVGSLEDRAEWENTLGVPLDIHNLHRLKSLLLKTGAIILMISRILCIP